MVEGKPAEGGREGRPGAEGGELLALERSLLSNQQRLRQILQAKEQNLRHVGQEQSQRHVGQEQSLRHVEQEQNQCHVSQGQNHRHVGQEQSQRHVGQEQNQRHAGGKREEEQPVLIQLGREPDVIPKPVGLQRYFGKYLPLFKKNKLKLCNVFALQPRKCLNLWSGEGVTRRNTFTNSNSSSNNSMEEWRQNHSSSLRQRLWNHRRSSTMKPTSMRKLAKRKRDPFKNKYKKMNIGNLKKKKKKLIVAQ